MGIAAVYFIIAKKLGVIRLSPEEETLGGDIHYFGPMSLEGKISTYARHFELKRLDSPTRKHDDV
jgi:hypothetical protein